MKKKNKIMTEAWHWYDTSTSKQVSFIRIRKTKMSMIFNTKHQEKKFGMAMRQHPPTNHSQE